MATNAVVTQIAMDTLVKQIVPDVSKQMADAGISLSPATVMQVLRIAMEAVEGSPVKGAEQKDLAIKIVLEIAEGAKLPEDQLSLIKGLVEGGLVSDTIDLIIDASRGKLNINKAKQVAQGCFAKCFAILFKRNRHLIESNPIANVVTQVVQQVIEPQPQSAPQPEPQPEQAPQSAPQSAPEPQPQSAPQPIILNIPEELTLPALSVAAPQTESEPSPTPVPVE